MTDDMALGIRGTVLIQGTRVLALLVDAGQHITTIVIHQALRLGSGHLDVVALETRVTSHTRGTRAHSFVPEGITHSRRGTRVGNNTRVLATAAVAGTICGTVLILCALGSEDGLRWGRR